MIKIASFFVLFILSCPLALADLIPNYIRITANLERESYYEGDRITFNVTLTNIDKENAHPVLIPHTQSAGQKLFYLNVYDRASNTYILRYTEEKDMRMMLPDTGTVKIIYLKPLEKFTFPIHLNDSDDSNYLTQNASHHSLGVPLFAGIYKVRISYNPKGLALADKIYNFYDFTEYDLPNNGKEAIPSTGFDSDFCTLKLKRSADTVVTIERKKYYIKTDGNRFYYYDQLPTNLKEIAHPVHITSLPAETCSVPKGEYFYSQFTDSYNEFIVRFDDGDILEYRKFNNWCPQYLYTERYNDLKQKTHYEVQLPDKKFYSVSYYQPSGKIHQESLCSDDGTLCQVTTYFYNDNGELTNKKTEQTEPCAVFYVNGKKYSGLKVSNLNGK